MRFASFRLVLPWLLGILPPLAQADLLDQIPANAKLVVIAKDIPTLEKDLQAFAAKLDLPLDPALIDLDALTGIVGLPTELGRQAALVVTDVRPDGVLFLVELADPASVKDLPGLEVMEEEDEDEEDEDVDYKAEIMGMPAVIEVEGNLAKIQLGVVDDEGLEVVEDPASPLSKALTAHQKKILASSDLFFWLNVVEWRELADQGLTMMRDQMQAAMDQAGEQDLEVAPGFSMADYFKFLFDGLRMLTRETHSFYGGIAMDESDLHLLLSADYEPGSNMEKAFQPVAVPVAELLAQLPDRPFSLVSAAELRAFYRPIRDFTLGVVGAMFGKESPDRVAAIEKSMAYLEQTKVMSVMIEFAGETGMEGTGWMMSDDPEKLFKLLKESSKETSQQMALFGLPAAEVEVIDKMFDGQPGFEYTMDMTQMMAKQENEAVNQANKAALQAIYGTEGDIVYQVVQRKEGVGYALSTGPNPIQLLDGTKLLNQPLVKRTLQSLPSEAAAVGLVQWAGFVRFFDRMMKSQDLPMPNIPPVPLAPPIGWVMEVEKGITSLDLVVPVEAAQAISTFAIQAAQQVAPPADNEEMEDEEMDEDDDEEDEEGEEDEEENEEEEEAGEEEK